MKAVLGAEEQCTLPYLFPFSFNPLLPTQDPANQERGNDISNLSLSGIFEGAWWDACLKSSFAEHPRQSLPGGVQLSPVPGEAELVPSPREPPGLSHIPVLAPARLCPTWDVL